MKKIISILLISGFLITGCDANSLKITHLDSTGQPENVQTHFDLICDDKVILISVTELTFNRDGNVWYFYSSNEPGVYTQKRGEVCIQQTVKL